MIKIYRIFTLLFNLIAAFYILIEIHDLFGGYSTLNNPEDLSILTFIILALYFSISFNLETIKHFGKKTKHFEFIRREEIQRNLKRKEFSRIKLNGNLIVGIIIVLLMVLIMATEPLSEFLNDYFRLISVIVIAIYGLVQIHFSLIVKKKLKKNE